MKLGTTDMEVSRLTLGTWSFAGGAIWGEQDLDQSVRVVHAALDGGINFFDTAPGYGGGESERVLGIALEGRRDEAVIATKVSRSELAGESLVASCERSLRLLQTDWIDLLQVHWPTHEVEMEESIEALNRLKQAGKIRHFGVCNFGPLDMGDWLSAGGEMVSNQLPYSLLSRAIEFEIAPICRERGISILPYSPLMQGLLVGKYRTAAEVPDARARSRHFSSKRADTRHGEAGCEEATFMAIRKISEIAAACGQPMERVALAWLLAKEGVGSVIVGARNEAQLMDNLLAMELELSVETRQALDLATEEVKSRLGRNPDLWESPGRYR